MKIKHNYDKGFQKVDLLRRDRKSINIGSLVLSPIAANGLLLPFWQSTENRDLKKQCMKNLIPPRHHNFFPQLTYRMKKMKEMTSMLRWYSLMWQIYRPNFNNVLGDCLYCVNAYLEQDWILMIFWVVWLNHILVIINLYTLEQWCVSLSCNVRHYALYLIGHP